MSLRRRGTFFVSHSLMAMPIFVLAKLLEKEPDLMSGLMKLFEEKAKRDVEEKGKPNIAKSESLQTKLELKSTRPLTLPPLFAPFKDEKKGWTKSNMAEQVTLYINLLGYGIGGDKTFVSQLKQITWIPCCHLIILLPQL